MDFGFTVLYLKGAFWMLFGLILFGIIFPWDLVKALLSKRSFKVFI